MRILNLCRTGRISSRCAKEEEFKALRSIFEEFPVQKCIGCRIKRMLPKISLSMHSLMCGKFAIFSTEGVVRH